MWGTRGQRKKILTVLVLATAFFAGWLYYQNLRARQAELIALQARREKAAPEEWKEEIRAKEPEKPKEKIFPAVNRGVESADEEPKEEVVEEKYAGSILAGFLSPVIDFNKTDYEAALKTNKLIALYFYNSSCPACEAELADFYAAFNQLNTREAIGFRVNYNDGADNDKKNLSREFGIASEQAKVFLKNGTRILKSSESWDKERYLAEINKFR